MIVIHHNPECGTSRNTLKIIQDAGITPVVIDYLTEGWSRAQLLALFAAADLTPKTALRTSKSPAQALGLLDEKITDDEILEAMLIHPILVNRPIVCSPKGVKLCRPSEQVLDLLDLWPEGPYYKEDGEMILDEQGKKSIEKTELIAFFHVL
ncbi:MAG: arsenate reductase (glutaredoxin) [Marinomonas sp.]